LRCVNCTSMRLQLHVDNEIGAHRQLSAPDPERGVRADARAGELSATAAAASRCLIHSLTPLLRGPLPSSCGGMTHARPEGVVTTAVTEGRTELDAMTVESVASLIIQCAADCHAHRNRQSTLTQVNLPQRPAASMRSECVQQPIKSARRMNIS
jgi:hypothetical protein